MRSKIPLHPEVRSDFCILTQQEKQNVKTPGRSANKKKRRLPENQLKISGKPPFSTKINYRYQPFLCLLARLRRISAFMPAAPEPWAPVI